MTFTKRSLAGPATLGQRLRQLREEVGLSIEVLGRELQIAPKHLTAIEEGRYHDLPGLVYARNFVRQYVGRMELDLAAAMEKFEGEYRVIASVRPSARPLLAQRATTESPWWRRHNRLVVAGGVILLVLAYFSWQIFRLYSPPRLVISSPAVDSSTRARTLTITGQTEPNVIVTVNNQTIAVDTAGHFTEQINLQPGLNTLSIAAKKKRGEARVEIRRVLVE